MSIFFSGQNNVDDDYPIGTILIYSGVMVNATSILGWLCCDGSGYKKSTYNELYDVIGVRYGNGDGGTNTDFNVPNFRGRFPIGNGLFSDISGNMTGETSLSISNIYQLPYHNHSASITDAGDHRHILYRSDGSTRFRKARQRNVFNNSGWPVSEGARDARFNFFRQRGANEGSSINVTTNDQDTNHSHGGSITIGNAYGSTNKVNIMPMNCSMFYIIKY
jgi:microcystin-dependent protein